MRFLTENSRSRREKEKSVYYEHNVMFIIIIPQIYLNYLWVVYFVLNREINDFW